MWLDRIRIAVWLALILGGTIGFLWSQDGYSSTFIRPEIVLPTDERGIIAFASQALPDRTFHFILDQIDVQNRAASVSVSFGGGTPEPFGFQFPYNVSLSPRSSPIWEEIPDVGSTYVYCSKCPPTGDLHLTWIGVVQRRTYGTYALVVPFSDISSIQRTQLDRLRSQLHLGRDVEFYAIKENHYELTVQLPEGASLQMMEPAPIHFGRASDKLWLYWDISKYFIEGLQALTGSGLIISAHPTIYMLFTSNLEQEEKETILFRSGVGFGISIPLLISGLVELSRDQAVASFFQKWNINRRRKQPNRRIKELNTLH